MEEKLQALKLSHLCAKLAWKEWLYWFLKGYSKYQIVNKTNELVNSSPFILYTHFIWIQLNRQTKYENAIWNEVKVKKRWKNQRKENGKHRKRTHTHTRNVQNCEKKVDENHLCQFDDVLFALRTLKFSQRFIYLTYIGVSLVYIIHAYFMYEAETENQFKSTQLVIKPHDESVENSLAFISRILPLKWTTRTLRPTNTRNRGYGQNSSYRSIIWNGKLRFSRIFFFLFWFLTWKF